MSKSPAEVRDERERARSFAVLRPIMRWYPLQDGQLESFVHLANKMPLLRGSIRIG
jgi:hypothetical protein